MVVVLKVIAGSGSSGGGWSNGSGQDVCIAVVAVVVTALIAFSELMFCANEV